ncbi:uncharacterized protein LOC112098011 [Citrus clementina]|uniref:uncharacterized protein LOC112098011 n=1 Tax=Citrus clementina TaxID=85681 RepID=UPI000CED1B9E|nr:uncharacterized protein LOC112098011 [Citrus x clementina]
MAAFYHVRSNSLPTQSHPFTSEVEETLSRLRSSQAASTIGHNANGLHDLHDCVDKIFQLPLIQQALSQGNNRKLVDELLNGSLRILDTCSIAQNALLQSKESVQGLQSVLRRRKGEETELKVRLRSMENKRSASINEERVSMRKEVEGVTITAFESLLSLISGPRTGSMQSGFSLVLKLIRPKRIACEEDEKDINEFDKVDAALIGHKTIRSDNIFCLQNQLKELESSIQDLKEGLESLYRRLIKARVSLLNILSN